MKINAETLIVVTKVVDNVTQPDELEVTIVMHPFYNPATQAYTHSLADNNNGYTKVWNRGIATPLIKGFNKTGFRKTPQLIATYEWKNYGNTAHAKSVLCTSNITFITAPALKKAVLAKLQSHTLFKLKDDASIGAVQKFMRHTSSHT